MPGELTATLTIDAKADQTSALIDTLGLGWLAGGSPTEFAGLGVWLAGGWWFPGWAG
jgi:hypothetical protein